MIKDNPRYNISMKRSLLRRTQEDLERLARAGLDWATFSTEAAEKLRRAIPFESSCWYTVDPSTGLFTGSLNRDMRYAGAWAADYEYLTEDVNKWWFLAHSGRLAGATSLATHGDLSRSARHRSQEAYGFGDELRVSFVANGVYWGAAGFLRDRESSWFTEEDVGFLASLSKTIAGAFRRGLLTPEAGVQEPDNESPGVIVFGENDRVESLSPGAERWIAQIVEIPPPSVPDNSKVLQAIVARTRALLAMQNPGKGAPQARVRTRTGRWLLLYGTCLSGGAKERMVVIIRSATPHEIAPLIALAYGLSERECQIIHLCIKGHSTREIAQTLGISPYTVQDHLKSIFDKTGTRSRGELVGRFSFQAHMPRWTEKLNVPSGLFA